MSDASTASASENTDEIDINQMIIPGAIATGFAFTVFQVVKKPMPPAKKGGIIFVLFIIGYVFINMYVDSIQIRDIINARVVILDKIANSAGSKYTEEPFEYHKNSDKYLDLQDSHVTYIQSEEYYKDIIAYNDLYTPENIKLVQNKYSMFDHKKGFKAWQEKLESLKYTKLHEFVYKNEQTIEENLLEGDHPVEPSADTTRVHYTGDHKILMKNVAKWAIDSQAYNKLDSELSSDDAWVKSHFVDNTVATNKSQCAYFFMVDLAKTRHREVCRPEQTE